MKDILIFIFSFYFCLISVLAYGEIFHKVFLKKLKTIENVNIYSGFYGLMFLTLISLFTSLFVPHNFYHNILIHGFGFIYFFLSNFKKKNVIYYKHIIFITIFFISVLLISKTHDDFSFYHYPFTKFLTENHIIFGMGHLNVGYNFLSSLFFLNSTFYLPFIELYSFHFSALFFLIFFNYFLLNEIFSNKKDEFFRYFYFLALIFFNISFNRLAEFGMDKGGQLLIVILIIKLTEIITINKKNQINEILLLLPLLGLCISSKTYFLSYLLLSFSIILIKGKFLNKINFILFSRSSLSFFLIILLMFVHHFISTGCLISPLPYLCFDDNFNWARQVEDVRSLSMWVEQWSKAGASPTFIVVDGMNYIKNFNWVTHWFEKYFLVKFLDQIGILIFSIILCILFFKRLSFSKDKIIIRKELFVIYFLILVIFYIWFTHHPTLRYGGYSIFFLVIAFPVAIILSKLKNTNNHIKKFKFFIIFIIIIVNIKNFIRINSEIDREDVYRFKNFPYFAIYKKDFTKKKFESGLTIYKAHHCWDTPSPCGGFDGLVVNKKMGYYFILNP